MLIHCPTCASRYDLAPELLAPGRILRCAHCRDAWTCAASDTAAPTLAEIGPRDGREIVTEARSSRRPIPARDGAGRRRRRVAWHALVPDAARLGRVAATATVALSVVGGMAAVAAKERVVAAFPPSAAVFATLGLPVNLRGLAFGGIHSTVLTGEGAPTLTLEGQITNLRPQATPVPALRIAVRDRNQRELYYWTAPAPKAELAVGETVQFRSRLATPPRDGQEIAVSFVERSPAPRRMADASLPGAR